MGSPKIVRRNVAGLIATFNFDRDLPTARCGYAEVVLHHHPVKFPNAPWSVEMFYKTEVEFGHFSGEPLAVRPTEEEFIAIACQLFEDLAQMGNLA